MGIFFFPNIYLFHFACFTKNYTKQKGMQVIVGSNNNNKNKKTEEEKKEDEEEKKKKKVEKKVIK